MLQIDHLNVFYDKFQALYDVNLEVNDDEVVILIGRNGTGKTTTMKAIMGMLEPASGSIRFHGEELTGKEPFEVARTGISLIPDDRRIMPELTVYENLRIGYIGHKQDTTIEDRLDVVFEYFPRLEKKRRDRAAAMSGGEQQMLAIGRALMSDPELLLVDEPVEGLMPKFVQDIEDVIYRLNKEGIAMMVIEHDLDFAFNISDRAYIIHEGRIVESGPSESIRHDEELKRQFLTV